jgi:hypothetical protein
LDNHHIKVGYQCSTEVSFHILQHSHLYSSSNFKYLFRDNMDKINHEPVPAKVIKYATLDELPKYSWLTTPKKQSLNLAGTSIQKRIGNYSLNSSD